jgi:hypothetical protein
MQQYIYVAGRQNTQTRRLEPPAEFKARGKDIQNGFHCHAPPALHPAAGPEPPPSQQPTTTRRAAAAAA